MQLDTQAEKLDGRYWKPVVSTGTVPMSSSENTSRQPDYVKRISIIQNLSYSGKFDTFLVESIKYDYFNKKIQREIQNKYNLIFSYEKNFKNLKNPKGKYFWDITEFTFFTLIEYCLYPGRYFRNYWRQISDWTFEGIRSL